MFERYTEKARRVIFFARYEASHYGSPEITTEHLLLGLMKEERKIFEAVLPDAEIDSIQEEVRKRELSWGRKQLGSVDLPLSNPGKRALAYAAEEADRRSDRHIGSEHLLMGLLRETSCDAAEILRKHGVKLDELREIAPQDSPYPARRFIAYGALGTARLGKELSVEFIDAVTKERIGISVPPVAIPSLGEEIILEGDGLTRSFRVVNVAYVMQEQKSSWEALQKKLTRIVVSLEMTEGETGQTA